MQKTAQNISTFSPEKIKKIAKEYLWELIKFSWLIVIIAIGIGYYMYQSKKKIPIDYVAYLSFTINEGSGADQSFMQQVLGGGMGFGLFDSEIGKGSSGVQMLQELIRTRKTMELILFKKITIPDSEGVLKNDFFIHHYLELNGYRKIWKEDNHYLADVYFSSDSLATFTREQNSLLGFVHGKITKTNLSENLSKAGILTLVFKSQNEQFSYHFLSQFFNELNTYYTQKSIEKQQRIYKAAVARKDSLEKEMNLAEKKYIKYLNTHNLSAMGQHAEQIEIQYLGRKLSGEMEGYFMAIKNVETSKIALEQQTPLLQPIDKPLLPLGRDIPNTFLALLIGMFIGGFLGTVLIVGRKAYQDFIRVNNLKEESSMETDEYLPSP